MSIVDNYLINIEGLNSGESGSLIEFFNHSMAFFAKYEWFQYNKMTKLNFFHYRIVFWAKNGI